MSLKNPKNNIYDKTLLTSATPLNDLITNSENSNFSEDWYLSETDVVEFVNNNNLNKNNNNLNKKNYNLNLNNNELSNFYESSEQSSESNDHFTSIDRDNENFFLELFESN